MSLWLNSCRVVYLRQMPSVVQRSSFLWPVSILWRYRTNSIKQFIKHLWRHPERTEELLLIFHFNSHAAVGHNGQIEIFFSLDLRMHLTISRQGRLLFLLLLLLLTNKNTACTLSIRLLSFNQYDVLKKLLSVQFHTCSLGWNRYDSMRWYEGNPWELYFLPFAQRL